MGASFSEMNMCCKNDYTIKNGENDLDLFKKDVISGKSNKGRQQKMSAYDENINNKNNNFETNSIYILNNNSEVNLKIKRNKEILEKHMKDSFFKLNSSDSRLEIMDKINKLAEIVKMEGRILKLKVLNSSSNLEKGTIIKINCQGIFNNNNVYENNNNLNEYIFKRKEFKDGLIYFGYYPETEEYLVRNYNYKNNNYLGNTIDFNIPIHNVNNVNNNIKKATQSSHQLQDQTEPNNIGRHFQIEFKLDKLSYFIRDLGIGYGSFVRLDYPLILKDNHLINIGETFLVSNIINEDASQISQLNGNNSILTKTVQLKLKVYGVNNNGETYYFPPLNRNINIGRYSLADIQINDKLLSKIHCIINHSEKDGWTLLDGHDDKPSTNGTWLYLNEDLEIYDKMIFKTNQTILQCYI